MINCTKHQISFKGQCRYDDPQPRSWLRDLSGQNMVGFEAHGFDCVDRLGGFFLDQIDNRPAILPIDDRDWAIVTSDDLTIGHISQYNADRAQMWLMTDWLFK